VPLTLRLAFRQRVASWARLTDFVGSLRSWISDSEKAPRGGIVCLGFDAVTLIMV
jgi:hypothetical protein